MTTVGFSLGDRLAVTLTDTAAPERLAALVDPCPLVTPSATPDLAVDLTARLDALDADARWDGDGGDGWRSSGAGGRLRLAHREGGAADLGDLTAPPVTIGVDPEMPRWRAAAGVLVPALQALCPARDLAVPHAAAAFDDHGAVLILGWSESGKTETALALHERGWSVLSDKWTVVDDAGRAGAFPMRAGVRGWTLTHLPALRGSLPRSARARMAAAAPLAEALGGGARRARGQMVAALTGRAADALRQAERLSVPVSALRHGRAPAPGGVPVTLVVMLSTVADGPPRSRPIDRDRLLERALTSLRYERGALSRLTERARSADGRGRPGDRATADAREAGVLARALDGIDAVEITCPFPADPGTVADLVERCR